DYTPPADSLTHLTFFVEFGVANDDDELFAYDKVAVVRRRGTNAPAIMTDKAVYSDEDYLTPPAVTVEITVSGNNVRCSVTNDEAGARYARISLSPVTKPVST